MDDVEPCGLTEDVAYQSVQWTLRHAGNRSVIAVRQARLHRKTCTILCGL